MNEPDHERMTDEGCPHAPPEFDSFAIDFDFLEESANRFDAMMAEIVERHFSDTPIST